MLKALVKSNGFLEPLLCPVDFKPTANNVHTKFPTTILSSVVCPVGGGGLVQLEHVGKSSTKDWTQPVRRQVR